MLKHVLKQCVPIFLTVGYIFGMMNIQDFPAEVVSEMLTLLVFGLWMYILVSDFDTKEIMEHRLTAKHVAYEACYALSLILVSCAYCINESFAWALTCLIGGVVMFFAGTFLYAYYFKTEDAYISAEMENCRHLIWVLSDLKKDIEGWTEERIVEYATQKFRFYPKRMHLERGIDVLHPVDDTNSRRTLAEMKAEDPNSTAVLVATENMQRIARDFLSRKASKAKRIAEKKAAKEAAKAKKEVQ